MTEVFDSADCPVLQEPPVKLPLIQSRIANPVIAVFDAGTFGGYRQVKTVSYSVFGPGRAKASIAMRSVMRTSCPSTAMP